MTPDGPLVLAHAFGERYELPIPLWLFVVGGAAVVLLSFLLVLRRRPVTHPPIEAPDTVPPAPLRPVSALVSIAVLLLVAVVGVSGTQETSDNIAPLAFWVVFWIAFPLSCGLLGDWTRPWNPFANLARLGDDQRLRTAVLARKQPLEWGGLGWWPAVALFVLLVLGELVFNLDATQPAAVGGILLVYAVLSFFLGLLFGPAWLARGEVFSGLFNAWGRLGWFRFGAPGRRGFAGGLDVPFEASLSRVLFVLLLLVSINFDGLLATPQWARYERTALGSDQAGIELLRTVSLVVLVVVVLAVFAAFATASARLGGFPTRPVAALADLLPSLVPIAFGYLVAHYVQYLAVNLQLLYPLAQNPGFGPSTSTFTPNTTVLPNGVLWYLSVVVIVAVHVVAVVIAHQHLASRARGERAALRSEYPWLVAMVAYTAFSLFLIAQPLTEETGTATSVAPHAAESVQQ
ncbi:MAG: hypothetical protein JWN87_2661 [Frankiales bacterium]|jgi:uncharacterized membrane protein YwzB|nr:hypothetical protein [Frankiales bacterium]MCW2586429.1 hypothetical protein [Frankiales bacterium]